MADGDMDGLFPVVIGLTGTMQKAQPVVATVDADVFTTTITAALYRGAVGTCVLDITISGTGVIAAIAFGSLSDIQLTLSGSGRSGQATGQGTLPLEFLLLGSARASAVTSPSNILYIGITLSGQGRGGIRGEGSLVFDDFDIDPGTGHLTPIGTGSLVLDLDISALASLYAFDTDEGVFSAAFKCLTLNTKNFALTEYDFTFNSLISFNGHNLGAAGTALYELTGDSDDGANIPWKFKTGKIDMEKNNVNRLRYVWLSYRPSGDLILIVDDGFAEYEYPVISYDTDDNTVKVKIGKGIKEKYVQFELKNIDRQSIFLDRFRIFTEPARKMR